MRRMVMPSQAASRMARAVFDRELRRELRMERPDRLDRHAVAAVAAILQAHDAAFQRMDALGLEHDRTCHEWAGTAGLRRFAAAPRRSTVSMCSGV